MIFLHAVKLGGIWTVLLLPNGEASHLRAEEHSSGRRGTADLHLRIASDAPVRSTVNTLDCVLGESDKAIKRNSLVNSEPRNAKMMDADVMMAQEARKFHNSQLSSLKNGILIQRSFVMRRNFMSILRENLKTSKERKRGGATRP